jgi:putative ABC transport system permease protein
MNVFTSVSIALRSLIANKLRAGLTMLGIIIGVGAVIALVAAGAGAQAQVAERFESLGSNLLVISPGSRSFRGVSRGASTQSLTNDDVEAIAHLADSVSAIAPEYSSQSQQVVYGNKNTQTTVLGVTPDYQTVREWRINRGRFIESLDLASQTKVVVLGGAVAEELFGELVDPLRKTIKISRQNYEVVGVLASKGVGGFQNLDDQVFIPLSTAQIKFGGAGNRSLRAINVQVTSANKMERAKAELVAILRARHRLAQGQSDDFTIQDQAQIVESVQETTQTFTVLLASIAAISLLVGGIGVMNIMLVSVTERTREIGIRKAVGAKRRDIMAQFLVEAMVLCLLGGLIGVLVGYGGAQVITPLLGVDRALVTPESVALAVGVSMAVGLFFGLYPAGRAAALKPIDALRYE